ELGWQARGLRFTDRLQESTTIVGRDTLGNSVTVVARSLDDTATLNTAQGALWLEDAVDVLAEPGRLRLVPSLRADYFAYNSELTVSPRLNAVLRMSENVTWTAGLGVYHQAPTYRELRGDPAPGQTVGQLLDGDLASQRAVQAVVGLTRFFPSRRLGLRAEAYYKRLTNLISYDVENIRVDYSGENDSEGYAGGFDVQLRGELVPGLESWVNYGFLLTEERFFAPDRAAFGADAAGEAEFDRATARFVSRGGGAYVPRPTDRRHNLTFFVQDNVPGDDTWSLHIRTLYGTGVPTTGQASTVISNVSVFEPGPRNQLRLPSYVRFDLGATKRLRVGTAVSGGPLAMLATVEVLNVFNQDNTIAYSWVEQNNGGRRTFLAVPTRLTPRTLNVRVRLDF
ncbi:MAG TPA: TonB-dependent receptor, partial [Rubricoccaceae bacterium]